MQLRSLLIRLHLAHGIGYAGMVRVLQHCRQVQTVVTDPRRLGKLLVSRGVLPLIGKVWRFNSD